MNNWNTTRPLINNNKRYQDGDLLNAASLNAIVDETIITYDLMCSLFGEETVGFLKDGLKELNWYSKMGLNFNEERYEMSLGMLPLYVDADYDAPLYVNAYREGNKIKVLVTESLADTGSNPTCRYEYQIHFYADESLTKRLFTKTGIVNYMDKPVVPSIE